MQSKSSSRAAKAQEASEMRAMEAQRRAAGEVRQLNAPGVAAYGTGLNALTGRLGLPTQGVASATAQGAFDPQAYLAANPDVQAEYARLNPTNDPNHPLGSATDFAQQHYTNFGSKEPGRPGVPQAQPAQAPGNALTGAPGASPGTYGTSANPTYQERGDFKYGLEDYKASPGYAYQMEQGLKGVLASSSATGALQSGAALKALQDRGQQIAYQDYTKERDFAAGQHTLNRSWDRSIYGDDRDYLTSRFDRGTDDLMRYTGIGQNALTATGNAALGEGSAIADGYTSIGNAKAGNALQQGNIWSGVVGNVAGAAAGIVNGGGLNALTKKPIAWSPSWGGGS
jgi:hypothetical protein